MKKIVILLVAAMTITLYAQAQSKLKFGLKAGVNFTNISLNKSVADNWKNQAGFHVGPTVKLALPVTGLSVDASALYDHRSAKVSVYELSALGYYPVESTVKQQSIQIPINVRYGIGLGSVANLFAFAGPQFGFNVGEKHQAIWNDAAEWTLRSSNFSANFGIGVTLLKHLQVTANYNLPFGKTSDIELSTVVNGVKQVYDKSDAKANAWQISAAYFF